MADFTIDVGFSGDDLRGATQSPARDTGGNGGFAGTINKGFKMALTGLGIVGLLTNLRSALDLMGFLLGVISTALAFLINLFVQFIVPFFKDPGRALLGLGIDIANMFLSGIEFLTNAIITGLNFIPGVNIDQVELPRIQKDIVLEAYDAVKAAADDFASGGETTFEELKQASRNFSRSFMDAMLTEEEFIQAEQLARESGLSLQQAAQQIDSTGQTLLESFETGVDTVKTTADSAFSKLDETLVYIENKARDLLEQERVSQSSFGTTGGAGDALRFGSFVGGPIGAGLRVINNVKNLYNRNTGFRED